MNAKVKREALKLLAQKRQGTRWKGYRCIGDYHGGAYECDFVSPFTKSAGNVDSPLMVILQDWSSDDAICGGFDPDSRDYGHSTGLPTNVKLKELLGEHFGVGLERIYATNLFPFIKMGEMGRAIPRKDLVRAAEEFTAPEIRIVNPKLVICLGLATFNAIREVAGLDPVHRVASAITAPFSLGTSVVWCQAHTGGRGQAMRNRGRKRVSGDWKRMSKHVKINMRAKARKRIGW
jgi:hypothetical protein